MCYNLNEQKLLLDCTHSGKEDGVRKVALQAGETLALRIFVDRSSVEVFANEGQATMTSRIYPKESRLGIELFTEGGNVIVKELTYWNLKDIWG
jgi:beta-fructofuranosidase